MRLLLIDFFDRFVLDRPWLALVSIAMLTGALMLFVPDFELDASSDSLLLEQDSDLRYYRETVARYGSDNYLVVTYTASRNMFSNATLADLTALRDALLAMDSVERVISILDVPLVNSPPTTLAGLQERIPTLEDPRTDRELAENELRESPVYSNLLMSLDGDTTALLVRFRPDQEYNDLLDERDELLKSALEAPLSGDEARRKRELDSRIKELRLRNMEAQQQDIVRVRELIAEHADEADIHLGGLPIIVSDMIDYIRYDIAVFGTAILLFLVVLLSIIFSRVRWVVISLLCCVVSVAIMTGLLGLLEWRVTVVSSNFVALMLIFSLSLTVHLIQQYRELHSSNPDADQRWLVRTAMRDKARPCFYTALTTMVGFASLLISGIRPVIDFGLMMVIGMVVVLATAFILFPAMLMFVSPGVSKDKGDATRNITGAFAGIVDHQAGKTVLVCAVVFVISVIGVSRLEVENRFIDYFKENTEIHQGMLVIDRELGGTAPLDVIIDAEPEFLARQRASAARSADDDFADEFSDDIGDEFTASAGADDEEFVDEFDDEFEAEGGDSAAGYDRPDLGSTSYWYNTFRLERLREVHDYLDDLPETGKVLSLATTLDVLKLLNNGEEPGTFFLSVLYKRLPDLIKEALVDPYMSADGNQIRISMRVFESDKNLRRGELIKNIRTHLVDNMGFQPDRVHITGMLVLYNNVLQSLYRSQILTMGAVFLAIVLMFLVLFRSFKIALIAVVPSFLSVIAVLGIMGWLGIPLDIMTITIAAVCVGIGVDDSIHYVDRYRLEIAAYDNHLAAMYRCHASVGRAILYTSIIVVAGFSILALSNFIPSILFGLLTGLALTMALVANLTILPLLLRWQNVR